MSNVFAAQDPGDIGSNMPLAGNPTSTRTVAAGKKSTIESSTAAIIRRQKPA